MFHTRTHIHSHTHFPQVAFGGKAILRFFNEVPFFQSSQQCYHPLFLYGTDLLLNLRSAWHSLQNICSLLHAFDCRWRSLIKKLTCYRDKATYYPLSGLFNFLFSKRLSSISRTHQRINICEYIMTLQDFMEFNALS